MRETKEWRSSRGVQPSPISRSCRPPGTRAGRWRRPGRAGLVAKTKSCSLCRARRGPAACCSLWARSASTAIWGRARVRREFSVLVSPWARTERQTAALAGTGGLTLGSPKVTCPSAAPGLLRYGSRSPGIARCRRGSGCRWRRPVARRLAGGSGSCWAARLAFGGVDEGGDVAGDQVAGFGVADGPGERVVAHRLPRRVEYRVGHGGQCLVDVVGGELAQSPGADRGQDRRQHVLVLLDVLADRPSRPSGSQSSAARRRV